MSDSTTVSMRRNAAVVAASLPEKSGSSYPEPYRSAVEKRAWRALGDAFDLKNFGVNLVRLPPGVASSQLQWHTHEDEFVYMLEGEAERATDAGVQRLTPGMCAGFPAGKADGHHLVNRSDRDAVFLVVGDRRRWHGCLRVSGYRYGWALDQRDVGLFP